MKGASKFVKTVIQTVNMDAEETQRLAYLMPLKALRMRTSYHPIALQGRLSRSSQRDKKRLLKQKPRLKEGNKVVNKEVSNNLLAQMI